MKINEEKENFIRETIAYYCGGTFENKQDATIKILSFLQNKNKNTIKTVSPEEFYRKKFPKIKKLNEMDTQIINFLDEYYKQNKTEILKKCLDFETLKNKILKQKWIKSEYEQATIIILRNIFEESTK